MTCKHDLSEMETACADGYCPLCMQQRIEELEEKEILACNEAIQAIAENKRLDAALAHLWAWLPIRYREDYLKDYPTEKEVIDKARAGQ